MSIALPRFVRRPAFVACVVAGGLSTFTASSAQAQLFNFLFGDGLKSSQIERMLEIRGMQPLGPISRNGRVYIADVALSGGRSERLVIDAYDGRILERFRLGPRYYGDIASAPRPPSDIGADATERPASSASSSSGWPIVIPFIGESVARGDDAASPSAALPLHGDDADAKNKAKAQAKQHKKIDLTQPSSPSPSDAKPAASEASASAPAALDAKPASAAAAPAPVAAPAPKTQGGKPAINDVPVDPLD
jgi:hypothetical protein